MSLRSWVNRAFPDRAFEVVDKSFVMERAGKETVECLISLMRIGLLCSRESARARSSMRDVSNLLKGIEQDWTKHVSAIDYFQSTL
ncbi:hypothetical protein SUGI_0457880 [Cryptomeria japonica]|nr:hypothetical protein SUGI_0457880 [Cryptomeria japonica]